MCTPEMNEGLTGQLPAHARRGAVRTRAANCSQDQFVLLIHTLPSLALCHMLFICQPRHSPSKPPLVLLHFVQFCSSALVATLATTARSQFPCFKSYRFASRLSQRHKQRHMVRDAKAVLGTDVRPRISEGRLRAMGITAELHVMKAIVVRER